MKHNFEDFVFVDIRQNTWIIFEILIRRLWMSKVWMKYIFINIYVYKFFDITWKGSNKSWVPSLCSSSRHIAGTCWKKSQLASVFTVDTLVRFYCPYTIYRICFTSLGYLKNNVLQVICKKYLKISLGEDCITLLLLKNASCFRLSFLYIY